MKIWLVKHPISKHYKETQAEAKRAAMIADARILDAKFAKQVDPSLVEDNKLTPLVADKPKKKAAPKKAAETEEKSEGGSE